jgi:hypothetical protein
MNLPMQSYLNVRQSRSWLFNPWAMPGCFLYLWWMSAVQSVEGQLFLVCTQAVWKQNPHILAQLGNSHWHGWYILKAVGLLPFSINFPFCTKAFQNEDCKFWPNLATPSDQVNIFWKLWIFSIYYQLFMFTPKRLKIKFPFFGLIRRLLRTWPIVSECYEYSPFTIKN